MFLIILIKSLIIGGLVGVGVGAGAARMFHAPTTQGMGAFRTLGELNSCEGDPASHFSFGLGFFFNAWASSVAAGSFTQDVDHRIIPNWGAAALMISAILTAVYIFTVIVPAYFMPARSPAPERLSDPGIDMKITLIALTALVILLSLFGGNLADALRDMAGGM